MRRPDLVDLRRLRPGLRAQMLAGTVVYDDQVEPVDTSTEHLRSGNKEDA